MEVQVIRNYRGFAGYPWLMSSYGGVTTREQPGDCMVCCSLENAMANYKTKLVFWIAL